MISLKIGGIILAAFIAGTFVASPELRAYAANTVFSTDIVDGEVKSVDIGNGEVTSQDLATSAVTNSRIATDAISTSKIGPGAVTNSDIAGSAVTTGKIKDGQVMSADIAQDAVGAREMKGVSLLQFSECVQDFGSLTLTAGETISFHCVVQGADDNMGALATMDNINNNECFVLDRALTGDTGGEVRMDIHNQCGTTENLGTLHFWILLFDT